ncbi:serine--tRNA ligase [Buchnera aphidicola (Nipponaphis monzeni)]|uniref:Serine--tRNA ligase n=1 Tax=Buchnera aphidicola (Nipponaphis monzeni) TaxID=2495405 RepID=A0A455TA85_9GAMM|nr:serine--tRNA ligase [Buchnera aphidicola]BBI01256.1 serine--tRNA ligase [Buchnera aphidicola (Nipponaphis monzeni)]
MINLKLMRKNSKVFFNKLQSRNFFLNYKQIFLIDNIRRKLQLETEKLQNSRRLLSKLIGQYKIAKKNYDHIKLNVIVLNKKLLSKKKKLTILQEKILQFLTNIPNIPHKSVPIGINSKNNVQITQWGKIKNYNFLIKDHIQLGNNLKGLDWDNATKISGSRFVVMKGDIALLYRALGQFMLDIHTKEHGYIETYVPYLVNPQCLFGTGQLPKFSKDLFYVTNNFSNTKSDHYILIPTAEVPLVNLLKNTTIKEIDLPIMLTALTPCFRSEASSYGKDIRGLIRMHQFDKVEIIQIVSPKNSLQALEILTSHAEKILKLLKLPYRKILLCTGDMGFSAAKTYDLEVWFPFQKKYREVSSCSYTSDFQTRRMQIKYLDTLSNNKKLLHVINGSGLAIGRTLAAILENYQDSFGRIEVPEILQKKYMNGLKFIK